MLLSDAFIKHSPAHCVKSTSLIMWCQWRRKFAKSGGAILLERKYFYGKKLNPMEHPLNQVGLQPHSPTLSAAYVWCGFWIVVAVAEGFDSPSMYF